MNFNQPCTFHIFCKFYSFQAGFSWHIGHIQHPVADRENNPFVRTQVHVSILDDNSPQDSETVVALVKASLALFKKGHPEIAKVYVRCDNAG